MLRFVRSVSLIGLGGIGSWLAPPLLRFLHTQRFQGQVLFIDGDTYTLQNLDRQDADHEDINIPKAQALARRLAMRFPGLQLRAVDHYVSTANVAELVREGTLAIAAVDNHPARALIARHAEGLRDVCVLSAGNEKYDGNVHILLRRAAKNLTAPLLERHPEIAGAVSGDRGTMGCAELVAQGDTQLLVTNFLAATAIILVVHALWSDGKRAHGLLPQEIYFDVRKQAVQAIPATRAEGHPVGDVA